MEEMGEFDSNKFLKDLSIDFKRTDEFYNSFRHQFVVDIFLVVKRYFKHLLLDQEMDNDIRLYADEMLSCVESVVYKDLTYPPYRLADELQMMSRISSKEPEEHQDIVFIDKVHQVAKEQIVKNFPQIMELSADGFRLLEKYSRMYNWEFVAKFYTNHQK